MKFLLRLGVLGFAMGLLAVAASAQTPEDPVIKARGAKALTQGVSESDLPPVPRGLIEPPPIPPPETHIKDMRGYRPSARNASSRKGRRSRAGRAGRVERVSKNRAKASSRSQAKSNARKGGSRRKRK